MDASAAASPRPSAWTADGARQARHTRRAPLLPEDDHKPKPDMRMRVARSQPRLRLQQRLDAVDDGADTRGHLLKLSPVYASTLREDVAA